MKNTFKRIILGILLIELTGCQGKITEVSTNTNNECNCKAQLLMEQKDSKIYTYCLNDATIKIDDKEKDIKTFLETDDKAIDKIIGTLKLESELNDGGTKVYKGENITLIKCHTLEGNNDIYIGNSEMEFKQNFCDNNNYTFVRTYTVVSIKKYTKKQYTDDGTPVTYANSYEVELYEFQKEKQKVILNNLSDIELIPNKTYEFEFQLYSDATDDIDSIEYIFKNSRVIEIRETDKVGLEQIQEPMREK